MPTNRIFPTTEQDMPRKEFNGIDWSDVESRMAKVNDEGHTATGELLKEIQKLAAKENEDDDKEDDDITTPRGSDRRDKVRNFFNALDNVHDKEKIRDFFNKLSESEQNMVRTSGKLPPGLQNYLDNKGKGKKDNNDDDKNNDGKKDNNFGVCKNCGKKKSLNSGGYCQACDGNNDHDVDDNVTSKKANVRQRKIHIAHANQISAEALEAARRAGDADLEKVIRSARHDRRVHLASVIFDNLDNEEVNKKIAKRNTNRLKIVAQASDAEKNTTASNKTTKAANSGGFKEVTAMTKAEKTAFQRQAIANGFAEEYVVSMLGGSVETPVTEAEKEIEAVMASKIPDNVKIAAVKGLIKVAELGPDQVARQKRFWKTELGYGDAAWIDDLFTTKYDANTKDDGEYKLGRDNDGD